MFVHIVFYFAKPSNRQPAVEEQLLRSDAGIFLREVRGEKLRETSDTFRFARSARGEHFGADEAQMRERFIAAEKVEHFHLVSLPRIRCFQSREELIHGNVYLDNLEFFARSRTKAHFIGYL